MSEFVQTVNENTLMTEVASIFESNSFHHLPVLDDKHRPIGMISSHDYRQLQHHFTYMNDEQSKDCNNRLFRSLIASEIMTENPICLSINNTIADAVKIFIQNNIHSILVVDEEKCRGIVTPYDIMKLIHIESEIAKVL